MGVDLSEGMFAGKKLQCKISINVATRAMLLTVAIVKISKIVVSLV